MAMTLRPREPCSYCFTKVLKKERFVRLFDDDNRPIGVSHEGCYVSLTICGACLDPLAGSRAAELTDEGIAYHTTCNPVMNPLFPVANPGAVNPDLWRQVRENPRRNIAPLVAGVAIGAAKKYGPGVARAAGKAIKKAMKKKRNPATVFDVDCSQCGATVGRHCTTPDGAEVWAHKRRKKTAEKASGPLEANPAGPGENGYIAFYGGRQIEVYADTSYHAQQKAVAIFKPPKSKEHMVHVVLAEKEGKPVTHLPLFANAEPGRGGGPSDPYLAQMMIEEAEEPVPMENPLTQEEITNLAFMSLRMAESEADKVRGYPESSKQAWLAASRHVGALRGMAVGAEENPVRWSGKRIVGCQSKNHKVCEEYQESKSGLWKCPTCHRSFCIAEGGSDSPDCDECWEKKDKAGKAPRKWPHGRKDVDNPRKKVHVGLTIDVAGPWRSADLQGRLKKEGFRIEREPLESWIDVVGTADEIIRAYKFVKKMGYPVNFMSEFYREGGDPKEHKKVRAAFSGTFDKKKKRWTGGYLKSEKNPLPNPREYPYSKILGRMKNQYGPRRGREVFDAWLGGVGPQDSAAMGRRR